VLLQTPVKQQQRISNYHNIVTNNAPEPLKLRIKFTKMCQMEFSSWACSTSNACSSNNMVHGSSQLQPVP